MLKFIKNEKKYWNFIRKLRNDSRIQSGFVKQFPNVTEKQQIKYMEKYNDIFYICIDGDFPVGYIRQLEGDIAVCTHPDYTGRGIGSFMINELMKLHPDCYAKIKLDNKASIRAFEKVGFKKKYYILEK